MTGEWIKFLDNCPGLLLPTVVIYIRTDPDICFGRMGNRNRTEEKGVSREYLRGIHKLHDDWLIKKELFSLPENCSVKILDGSLPTIDLVKTVMQQLALE